MKKQDKKASVLLYTEWAGPLRCLPLDDVGRLFLGILDYTATGEAPAFDSPGAAMAWAFIKMQLDSNLERWEAVCQQRREAGAQGGRRRMENQANQANATFAKQNQANQANAAFGKQSQANQAENENVNVNENEYENGKTTSSSSVPGEPVRTTTTTTAPEQEYAGQAGEASAQPAGEGKPEAFWQACGYPAPEAAAQAFSHYRESGMEEALILQAVREAAAHEARNPLAYARQVLEEALGAGQLTLAAWQARKRPAGGSRRVDRETPSGNDFLADALTRPRRHKRPG